MTDRHTQIRNAYKQTGGHASCYDGMMTYSTFPGKAICRIVWNMDGDKNAAYLERALSGVPEPTRARAISKPIAKAISLPSNHFANAFDAVLSHGTSAWVMTALSSSSRLFWRRS